jgi:hypothetical protein
MRLIKYIFNNEIRREIYHIYITIEERRNKSYKLVTYHNSLYGFKKFLIC